MDVPKDLVQAMLDAHYGAGICASQQFNHSLEQIAGMRRAARVCIERCREKMLASLSMEEIESDRILFVNQCPINIMLENRRSLPLEEPKKTPEERVTLEPSNSGFTIYVKVDGVIETSFAIHNGAGSHHAERYRRGLIAELREQEGVCQSR